MKWLEVEFMNGLNLMPLHGVLGQSTVIYVRVEPREVRYQQDID
jgi:hypothetical protein